MLCLVSSEEKKARVAPRLSLASYLSLAFRGAVVLISVYIASCQEQSRVEKLWDETTLVASTVLQRYNVRQPNVAVTRFIADAGNISILFGFLSSVDLCGWVWMEENPAC